MKIAGSNLINKRTLLLLAVANIIVIAVMQVVGEALKPGNIFAFEFAGTAEHARAMVADWKARDVLPQLYFHLGFDYVFMITYCAFLFTGCQLVSESSKFSRYFYTLGLIQPVASLLDAIENAALYQIASGATTELWPKVSFYCAAPKFAIALTALVSLIIAWIASFFRK
jgi:hypothetical protein